MKTLTPRHVLMFAPLFHEAILSGLKRQTIRTHRFRPINPGDSLSLRAWRGRPYGTGTTQEVLIEAVCAAIMPISIRHGDEIATLKVSIASGPYLDSAELGRFAVSDGFDSAAHMNVYWTRERELPFEGLLIRWEVPLAHA